MVHNQTTHGEHYLELDRCLINDYISDTCQRFKGVGGNHYIEDSKQRLRRGTLETARSKSPSCQVVNVVEPPPLKREQLRKRHRSSARREKPAAQAAASAVRPAALVPKSHQSLKGPRCIGRKHHPEKQNINELDYYLGCLIPQTL